MTRQNVYLAGVELANYCTLGAFVSAFEMYARGSQDGSCAPSFAVAAFSHIILFSKVVIIELNTSYDGTFGALRAALL